MVSNSGSLAPTVYFSEKEEEPPEVVVYFRGFVLFVYHMGHPIFFLLPDGIIACAVLKCNISKIKIARNAVLFPFFARKKLMLYKL